MFLLNYQEGGLQFIRQELTESESWEHCQDSLFQDQLLMKDSYSCCQCLGCNSPNTAFIVTVTYQIPGLCSATQLSGKPFILPELEDLAQPTLHACKKSEPHNQLFYSIFSWPSATSAISNVLNYKLFPQAFLKNIKYLI